MAQPVILKGLLRDRHWQTYRTFCTQYDKAARTIDSNLVGSYPSRAQLHRWLNGDLKGLPYPHHCQVLEAMFPGIRASQLFEVADEDEDRTDGSSNPDLSTLVAAGLASPATELNGWRSNELIPSVANTSTRSSGVLEVSQANGATAGHLAKSIMLLGKQLRLTGDEITELAKLAGHVVDLELNCTIDIDSSGLSEITYEFKIVNLTDRPVMRIAREQWFESTDGRLRITPHSSSDRQVHIQRVHDTANMSKFSCAFSPPLQPGEVGVVAYTVCGGQFLHDHYWRQSATRYTRRLTLTIRHRAVDMLVNCTAVIDYNDGSQESALDDLVCTCEDGEAVMTLTRDYMQPSEAATVRWEVSRGDA